ncbi:hypothetical protein H6P81_004464 [Aristolochia fimbriata]|uniref:Uncharacterized protein n=1 Tax=Aristolochia fimbriata TaxID=158543 RepID=A0AAV7FHQ3_ARIFI|nr:hypothetical protein H6P81_004464 [Aristolochia fimbriata]
MGMAKRDSQLSSSTDICFLVRNAGFLSAGHPLVQGVKGASDHSYWFNGLDNIWLIGLCSTKFFEVQLSFCWWRLLWITYTSQRDFQFVLPVLPIALTFAGYTLA